MITSSLPREDAGQLADDGFILRSVAEENAEFAVGDGHEGASHFGGQDSVYP